MWRRRGRCLKGKSSAFVQSGDSFYYRRHRTDTPPHRADHVTVVINRRTGSRQAAEVDSE